MNVLSQSFDRLIGPIQRSNFLSDYYGSRFLHVKRKDPSYYELFDWGTLASILTQHSIDYPRLRIVHSGTLLRPDQYISRRPGRRGVYYPHVRLGALKKELNRGSMIHLASVEEFHKPILQLAMDVQKATGGQVFVNAHIGLRASEGFKVHWDGHEVFVLQVAGKKSWKIFGTTEPSPLAVSPDDKRGAPSQSIWEGILETGDLLYLPRGVWHAAKALPDEETIHLTLGIVHPTAMGLLPWLGNQLSGSEIMRRDITAFHDHERLSQYLKDLQMLLSDTLDQETLRRYISDFAIANAFQDYIDLTPEKGR